MGFLIFILIVADVFYIYWSNEKINRLEYENKKLKEKVSQLEMVKPETNTANQETNIVKTQTYTVPVTKTYTVSDVENHTEPVEEKIPNVSNVEDKTSTTHVVNESRIPKVEAQPVNTSAIRTKKASSISNDDIKNTCILVVGAILIVLAAVVFLTSEFGNNILKTAVLILLFGIFYKFSNVAEKKYHLNKTSKAFFYISMAYIPICLISFCVLEIMGEYFSLHGDGVYMYCSFSMIVTSIVYYFMYKIQNAKGLFASSILAQLVSIVLFFVTFENNIYIVMIAFLVYNIFLRGLKCNDKELQFLDGINMIIPYAISCGIIYTFPDVSIYKLALFPLLAINLMLLRKKEEMTSYILSVVIYSFGFYLSLIHFKDMGNVFSIGFGCAYVLIVYVFQFFVAKDKTFSNSMTIFGMLSVVIYFQMSLITDATIIFVKPYCVAIIELILMILAYFKNDDKWKKVLEVLMPIVFIFICNNFVMTITDIKYTQLVLAIVLFIVSELIKMNNKRFYRYISLFINIFMSYVFFKSLFIYNNEISKDIVFIVLYNLIYGYIFYKMIYKSFPDQYKLYPAIMILICTQCIQAEIRIAILLVITLLLTIWSLFKSKKITIDRTISLIFFIAFLFNFDALIYIKYLFGMAWGIIHYFTLEDVNEKNAFRFIIYCFAILLLTTEINIMVLVIFAIIFTGLSLYKRKISLETGMSAIYIMFCLKDVNIEYILYLTGIVWGLVHYLLVEKINEKYIFKAVMYLLAFLLLNTNINILLIVGTIIFTGLSLNKRKISIETVMSAIYTMFCIKDVNIEYIMYLVGIAWGFIHYLVVYDIKEKNIFKVIMYGLALLLLSTEVNIIILMLGTLILTGLSLYKRKISVETVMSAIYLVFCLKEIDIAYFRYLMGILWSIIHYMYVSSPNEKTCFRATSYVFGFLLYREILSDLNVEYNSLLTIGITVLAYAILKLPISKDTKNRDVLEYFVFTLQYFYAITSYINNIDGMIYVLFLVFLTMYSYNKKHGAICIVTLAAILINALLLVRIYEVIVLVPWWIYLLLIGISLVVFAMRKESQQNKEKNLERKNFIKELKDRIEK